MCLIYKLTLSLIYVNRKKQCIYRVQYCLQLQAPTKGPGMKPLPTQWTGGNLKLPWCSDSKESAYSAENPGSIPKSGRSPREKNGYPHRYSCQDNSMDRGTWQATVHRIAESKDWVINTFTFTKTYSQSRWVVSCRIRTWICLSVSKTHFIPLFIFITFD